MSEVDDYRSMNRYFEFTNRGKIDLSVCPLRSRNQDERLMGGYGCKGELERVREVRRAFRSMQV